MTPIISNDLKERSENSGGAYWKTDQLQEGKWQILSATVITAANAKFGANEKDGLLKSGVLKEGETIQYKLKNEAGEEKPYESKGAAFFIAVRDGEEAGITENDWVKITATGKGETRRYTVAKA